MPKMTIDLSGRAGLAPKFNNDIDRTVATPELRYLGEEGQMASGIYNPFRRYGYLSPANAVYANVTPATGSFNAMFQSMVFDAVNGHVYFAEFGRQIFRGDTRDTVSLAPKVDLGATGTPKIYDLEIYQLNGVRKLFYVYEKSDNLYVGEGTLQASFSGNDDWLTADVAGSFTNGLTNSPFMRVADNGFAYLFADNDVHKIDGTTDGGSTGTISANVLQFPEYFQITDAVDFRGKLFIVIRQDTLNKYSGDNISVENASIGVYVWDRLSSVVNMRDFFPITGVKDIRKIFVSPQGNLELISLSSERTTEIRRFNGSAFNVVEELGLEAHPSLHDSLTTVSQSIVWISEKGEIYAYGKVSAKDKTGIYKIGTLPTTSPHTVANVGAITFVGANTDSTATGFKKTKNGLFVNYEDSNGTLYSKEWDIYGTGADGVSSTQEQGDVYTLVKFLPQMSTINHIDVYMYPNAGTGATVAGTMKFYFNQSSTAWASKTITRDESARGYKRFDINKPYVNSIQLETEFNTSASVGTFDFAPSFAVVDYTVTEMKG